MSGYRDHLPLEVCHGTRGIGQHKHSCGNISVSLPDPDWLDLNFVPNHFGKITSVT